MGRQKAYQREDLLEKAMFVFWDKGYINTSMSDVASATGVDKKCLFREFVNKESLFEEVLKRYAAWDRSYFESLFSQKPLGLDNVKSFLQGIQESHGTNVKGCLINKSIIQRNLITDVHFNIIQKTIVHLEDCLYKNLKAARRNGELKNTRTARELAKYLIYTTQGISTMSQYENPEENVGMVLNSILASL